MSDLNQQGLEILKRIDIASEYEGWGLELARETPTDRGWIAAFRHDSGEKKASAAINVSGDDRSLGRYMEHSGEQRKYSFWEAASVFGPHPDWRMARKHYAEKLGVELRSEPVEETKLPLVVEMPWIRELAGRWAQDMGGIDLESMEETKALIGKWHKVTVIAWEVWSAGERRGWYIRNANAQQGLKLGSMHSKSLLTKGCTPAGWIGQAIEKAEVVIWVEGMPDCLALISAIRNEHPSPSRFGVITSSHGASGIPPAEELKKLAGKRVICIGDADEGGMQGVESRASHAAKYGKASIWKLPYQVTSNNGRDLRDWLLEGNRASEILGAIDGLPAVDPTDSSPPPAPAVPGTSGSSDKSSPKKKKEPKAPEPNAVRRMLDKLGLVVAGSNVDGSVSIWDTKNQRWWPVKQIDRWTYESFLLLTGEAGRKLVCSRSSDSDQRIAWTHVRQEVSVLASTTQAPRVRYGSGVWACRLAGGEVDHGRIVLVTRDWAGVYDVEEQVLSRLDVPMYEAMQLEIGSGVAWMDFERLRALLELAKDQQWSQETLADCERMFASWTWETGGTPTVLVGLVLATWLQDLWSWCPHVSISGPSNAGKSILFQALSDLFLPICLHVSAHSTSPGIRQGIGFSRPPLLLDEWDSSQNKDRLLEMFRDGSRGAKRLIGSSSQQAEESAIKQMVWIAGITASLTESADVNRFIKLELRRPAASEYGRLDLRSSALRRELGEQILAIALVWSGVGMKNLAKLLLLKPPAGSSHDPRIVEGYSVPAAIFSAVSPPEDGILQNARESLLMSARDTSVESDEEDIIHAMLAHVVDAGGSLRRRSIGQLLAEAYTNSSQDAADALEREGLVQFWRDDFAYYGIYPRSVAQILRHNGHNRSSIREILLRTPGAVEHRVRCSLGQVRLVSWPADEFWHSWGSYAKVDEEWT